MPLSGPSSPAARNGTGMSIAAPVADSRRTLLVLYAATYTSPFGPNANPVGSAPGSVANTSTNSSVSLRYLRICCVFSLVT